MKLHLSLNVADLGRSVLFYEAFFGTAPLKLRADYANFDLQTPALSLALNAAAEPGERGKLNHLGLVVDRPEDVWAYKERLQAAGVATFDQRDATCCYATRDKIWVHDPDGNAWDIYALLDDLDDDPDQDHTGQAREVAQACCSPAEFAAPGGVVTRDSSAERSMMRITLKTGIADANRSTPCRCLEPQYEPHSKRHWRELKLHREQQDTATEAWTRLLDLIEIAATDGREEFAPGRELGPELWSQIVTLPATVAKLTAVRHLYLYGSSLVRIPPEIGNMTALEEFTPYTSYRLHWFPYEIMRCRNLGRMTVSTRSLYGNYKFRPPFPRLPQLFKDIEPKTCSVCDGGFGASGPLQYWVTRRGLPLLIHACSVECTASLPELDESYFKYIAGPHQGGLELVQPESEEERFERGEYGS